MLVILPRVASDTQPLTTWASRRQHAWGKQTGLGAALHGLACALFLLCAHAQYTLTAGHGGGSAPGHP